ncbi:hypothetical protein [Deinococcus humi]|uniref:hypothetical protein n=1 Tax=Deinococcus humi TaxID=662880 RepID=UPI0016748E67|nr:hypothetical protein [Deinococcus humi]
MATLKVFLRNGSVVERTGSQEECQQVEGLFRQFQEQPGPNILPVVISDGLGVDSIDITLIRDVVVEND